VQLIVAVLPEIFSRREQLASKNCEYQQEPHMVVSEVANLKRDGGRGMCWPSRRAEESLTAEEDEGQERRSGNDGRI